MSAVLSGFEFANTKSVSICRGDLCIEIEMYLRGEMWERDVGGARAGLREHHRSPPPPPQQQQQLMA